MEETKSGSGYNTKTKTFTSLRPSVDLPPGTHPLSAAHYVLSLHSSTTTTTTTTPRPSLISSSLRLSFPDLFSRVHRLSSFLHHHSFHLSKNDTAFVLSPNSTTIPVLYLSLLSLGVVISPANPLSTLPELSRLIQLSGPTVLFATSATASKLPHHLKHRTVLIDSPEFESAMTSGSFAPVEDVVVNQSDVAAIMYSSGTTGKVKGVMLTHRNLIAGTASYYSMWATGPPQSSPLVMLHTVPYFHVFGFFFCLKSVALGEAVVVMERFELRMMMRAVQEFRVTHLAVVPPVVVALAKSGFTDEYDFGSVQGVLCGAAPLGKDVIAAFHKKFPSILLGQVSS